MPFVGRFIFYSYLCSGQHLTVQEAFVHRLACSAVVYQKTLKQLTQCHSLNTVI